MEGARQRDDIERENTGNVRLKKENKKGDMEGEGKSQGKGYGVGRPEIRR